MQDLRKFFSKPQFDNFKNYLKGIINIECRRTINHINEGAGIKKDQSQLNRFVTKPKWDVDNMQRYYNEYVVKKVVEKKWEVCLSSI